jgi:hypothetical protein
MTSLSKLATFATLEECLVGKNNLEGSFLRGGIRLYNFFISESRKFIFFSLLWSSLLQITPMLTVCNIALLNYTAAVRCRDILKTEHKEICLFYMTLFISDLRKSNILKLGQ